MLVAPVAEAQASVELLTSAEQEVAKLLVRGFSNDEIAALRNTATRTVACQLQSIYRKLRVGSRVELARHFQGERWPSGCDGEEQLWLAHIAKYG